MKQAKGSDLQDRRKAAADAKLQMLKKFKAAPKPDDPEMVAKRAERKAQADAREARRKERIRVKQEEADRRAAEEAERIAAEEAARAAELRRQADIEVAKEAERKAERDRRYAARKARKRKR
ncbi:MAG: DUF6481 family protein [Alphaproteobacteria bacterium]|nr:DUF6481 family protein [Alphaproteobacteria bacterium]